MYRLKFPEATEIILHGLHDKSENVRTAACRVLGLGREAKALESLMETVQSDTDPVRRQAATALGQLGDKRAISALLKAAENSKDRFVEHAIVYALISLNSTESLLVALDNPSQSVKKVALIALDQMEESPLNAEKVRPFLLSQDTVLAQTGIWVAEHHPEWDNLAMEFLEHFLNEKKEGVVPREKILSLLTGMGNSPSFQKFVSEKLSGSNVNSDFKLLLIESIKQSPLEKIPSRWISKIGGLLRENDPLLKQAALEIIEARSLKDLSPELEKIIRNTQTPESYRLQALRVKSHFTPQLSREEFEMTLKLLDPKNDIPIRQLASHVLSQLSLDKDQLLMIAGDYLPKVEAILLPGLLEVFEGKKEEEIGVALLKGLQKRKDDIGQLNVIGLNKILLTYPNSVKQASLPLVKKLEDRDAERFARLKNLEENMAAGDVGKGRDLFFGKAICSTCHAVDREGGKFGPDLTNIGEIRSRHDLLEAILYPGVSFAREYETFIVKYGSTTSKGIITQSESDFISLSTAPGVVIRIQRSEIISMVPESESMMPAGLEQLLNEQEMTDLISFLETLPDGLGHLSKK